MIKCTLEPPWLPAVGTRNKDLKLSAQNSCPLAHHYCKGSITWGSLASLSWVSSSAWRGSWREAHLSNCSHVQPRRCKDSTLIYMHINERGGHPSGWVSTRYLLRQPRATDTRRLKNHLLWKNMQKEPMNEGFLDRRPEKVTVWGNQASRAPVQPWLHWRRKLKNSSRLQRNSDEGRTGVKTIANRKSLQAALWSCWKVHGQWEYLI